MKKEEQMVAVPMSLLLNMVHTMSYADGYIRGLGKNEEYISEMNNRILNDVLKIFEVKTDAV